MNTHQLKAYVVLATAGLCLALAAGARAAKPLKLDVCHAPPNNPENTQNINVEIMGNALTDHMAHGDWLVTDEMCDSIGDNNCDRVADPNLDDADCAELLGAGATCESGTCVEPPIVACPCAEDYTQTIQFYEGMYGQPPVFNLYCADLTALPRGVEGGDGQAEALGNLPIQSGIGAGETAVTIVLISTKEMPEVFPQWQGRCRGGVNRKIPGEVFETTRFGLRNDLTEEEVVACGALIQEHCQTP